MKKIYLRTLCLLATTLAAATSLAATDTAIVCNATSVLPTAGGDRFIYQIHGQDEDPESPSLQFGSRSNLNIWTLTASNTFKSVLNWGEAERTHRLETCNPWVCKLVQKLILPNSTHGLLFQAEEDLSPADQLRSQILFSGDHHLTQNTVSELKGQCFGQPFVLNGNHHRNDVIIDFNQKFIVVPNIPWPHHLGDNRFAARLDSGAELKGGKITTTSYLYRSKLVAVAVEHAPDSSAIYVYDIEAQTIRNIPYRLNNRQTPAGTTDLLPTLFSVKFEETGALDAFADDVAGNRYRFHFSKDGVYDSCEVLKQVGRASYCL